MKRGPYKKPLPFLTTDFCHYGCGCVATHITATGRLICDTSIRKCPVVRVKNSEGIKKAHREGRIPSIADMIADGRMRPRGSTIKGVYKHVDFGYGAKGNHKNALLRERGHKCESCSLTEWMGKPITLELEHTDGDRLNNTRENLRLLCPNCHSYTPTWRRKKSSLPL